MSVSNVKTRHIVGGMRHKDLDNVPNILRILLLQEEMQQEDEMQHEDEMRSEDEMQQEEKKCLAFLSTAKKNKLNLLYIFFCNIFVYILNDLISFSSLLT